MATVSGPSGQDLCDILYEQLKCYICENRVTAFRHCWYRCTGGHMVCKDCCYKTILQVKENPEKWNCSNCSCKSPFVLEHCKVIEALLKMDKMQFKCENLDSGCKETLDKEKMKVPGK